jgi:hypothetical protein
MTYEVLGISQSSTTEAAEPVDDTIESAEPVVETDDSCGTIKMAEVDDTIKGAGPADTVRAAEPGDMIKAADRVDERAKPMGLFGTAEPMETAKMADPITMVRMAESAGPLDLRKRLAYLKSRMDATPNRSTRPDQAMPVRSQDFEQVAQRVRFL